MSYNWGFNQSAQLWVQTQTKFNSRLQHHWSADVSDSAGVTAEWKQFYSQTGSRVMTGSGVKNVSLCWWLHNLPIWVLVVHVQSLGGAQQLWKTQNSTNMNAEWREEPSIKCWLHLWKSRKKVHGFVLQRCLIINPALCLSAGPPEEASLAFDLGLTSQAGSCDGPLKKHRRIKPTTLWCPGAKTPCFFFFFTDHMCTLWRQANNLKLRFCFALFKILFLWRYSSLIRAFNIEMRLQMM